MGAVIGLGLVDPTGRLLSARWRAVALATVLIIALLAFGSAVTPRSDGLFPEHNPLELGSGALTILDDLLAPAVLIAVLVALLAVASLVIRYRRGVSVEPDGPMRNGSAPWAPGRSDSRRDGVLDDQDPWGIAARVSPAPSSWCHGCLDPGVHGPSASGRRRARGSARATIRWSCADLRGSEHRFPAEGVAQHLDRPELEGANGAFPAEFHLASVPCCTAPRRCRNRPAGRSFLSTATPFR